MNLDDINLLDRDVFTRGVPHEWFTYLRKNAPVYRHPEPGSPGFWVFTKHQDVIDVGRNAKVFSSAAERGGVVGLEELPREQREQMENNAAFIGRMMLYMDPPDHTRYRNTVYPTF